MRLRPFLPCRDFDALAGWITDERTHALWCANRMPFPLTRGGFDAAMTEVAECCGDAPFAVTENDGTIGGFFCYSIDTASNIGMLKFVVIAPEKRGTGFAREMLRLAARYAFTMTGADAVRLCVFTENPRAQKCYAHVGFQVQQTEPGAFQFRDEAWGRCTMLLPKNSAC